MASPYDDIQQAGAYDDIPAGPPRSLAEAEADLPDSQATSAVGAAELEGARRTAAGVQQMGAHTSDLVNGLGWNGPNTASMTAAENARQAQWNAANGGSGAAAGVAQGVIGGGASMATAGLGLTGFWANIAAQVGLGAAQGAAQYSPTGDNAKNAAVGAAVAGPAAALSGAAPTITNWLRSKMAAALADGKVSEANALIKDVAPHVYDNMTLAMQTGSPWLAAHERTIASTDVLDQYAHQSDALAGDFAVALRQMPNNVGSGAALDSQLLASRDKAQAAMDSLTTTRNAAWQQGMDTFQQQAQGLGTMATPNLDRVVTKLQGEEADVYANPGKYNIGAGAKAALDDVKRSIQPPPNVDQDAIERGLTTLTSQGYTQPMIQQMREQLYGQAGIPLTQTAGQAAQPIEAAGRRLTGLLKIQQDADPKVQALGNQLRDAFHADLDAALPGHPALSTLMDTRDEYRRTSDMLTDMKNSVSFKLLGVGQDIDHASQLPSTATMWQGYKNLPQGQQGEVTSWLRNNNPSALPAIKDALTDEALKSSSMGLPIGGVRASNVQIPQFDRAVEQMQQYNGLWSPSEQRTLAGFRQANKSVAYTNMPMVSPGSQGNAADKMASTAYAGVGALHGSVALGTKFAMKALGHYGAFQDILMHPDTQNLIQRSMTSGPGQAASRAAVMAYLDHQADQYQGDNGQ